MSSGIVVGATPPSSPHANRGRSGTYVTSVYGFTDDAVIFGLPITDILELHVWIYFFFWR
jgi:hypothetical protein